MFFRRNTAKTIPYCIWVYKKQSEGVRFW